MRLCAVAKRLCVFQLLLLLTSNIRGVFRGRLPPASLEVKKFVLIINVKKYAKI